MAITILPPSDSDSNSDSELDPLPASSESTSESDTPSHPPIKRPKLTTTTTTNTTSSTTPSRHPRIFVPGETITTELQWMRGHGTYHPPTPTPSTAPTIITITATLPGPLQTTNKLLSIHPLAPSRYTASIGDLILGRIVSVDKSRWRVEIAASLLALLPLSAINLPGGVLRRRTTADELQMRAYFQEGDCVIAEVQAVGGGGGGGGGGGDGVAMLHTRSLRYGKVRNGVFLAVRGRMGVVRGRRQVFTLRGGGGGGRRAGLAEMMEVALGVNGYVWVSSHVDPERKQKKMMMVEKEENAGKVGGGRFKANATRAAMSISNLDELVSNEIYSSQNDEIDPRTRIEIARVCSCITLLAEAGVRVDEDTVTRAYRVAEEEADMEMEVDEAEAGAGDVRTGMGMGKEVQERIVRAVLNGGAGAGGAGDDDGG